MKKTLIVLAVIMICTVSSFTALLERNGVDFHWDYDIQPSDYDTARVTKNVDGDTIKVFVDGRTESIRMIGVDTPETVHPSKPVEFFGKEASNFTKTMCRVGDTVYLTYDWDPRDRYNRLLAYIWYKAGNGKWILHNLNLIANGYGHAYTSFAFREDFMDLFTQAERIARNNDRGLWGQKEEESTADVEINISDSDIKIVTVKYQGRDEYVEIENIGNKTVNLRGWRLVSTSGNQQYTFGSVDLKAGQSITVHSGPDATGLVWTRRYIHNNKGDGVVLYDAHGEQVSSFAWGDHK